MVVMWIELLVIAALTGCGARVVMFDGGDAAIASDAATATDTTMAPR
jgi:hypothetical protein